MDLAHFYNVAKEGASQLPGTLPGPSWHALPTHARGAAPEAPIVYGFRFYKIRQPDPATHTFAVSFRVFYEWSCAEAEGLDAGAEVSRELPWPELKVLNALSVESEPLKRGARVVDPTSKPRRVYLSRMYDCTLLSVTSCHLAATANAHTTHHTPRTTHHTPRTTHHAPRTTHHAPHAWEGPPCAGLQPTRSAQRPHT